MTRAGEQWAAQRLAEFLGQVASATDEAEAVRRGIEGAAEAVEAEVAAMLRDGAVVAAIGWPRFEVPDRALRLAVAGEATTVPVPGAGESPAHVVSLADDGGHLVVARAGDLPFGEDERAFLRGVANSLALTTRLLRTIGAERGLRARSDLQARENARLLDSLRRRQHVLEAMSRIQRAISLRQPLPDVLDAIVVAAEQLLEDAAAALLLRDPVEPEALDLVASTGFEVPASRDALCAPIVDAIAGRVLDEARLVVVEPPVDPGRAGDDMPRAVMAVPVHDDGALAGALVVASFAPYRRFSRADEELLRSIAEHASLAVTDARRAEAMLQQALHDALTGLPNRALFADRLAHALVHGRRRGTNCAVLFLDLDRFKTVNDSLGHAAGDDLLVEVGRRLDTCLRSADTPARLGGDEFAILLEDLAGLEEAELVAARVSEALRRPIQLEGREVQVSASIGIAVGNGEAEDLLRRADVAMYRAKSAGKGRAVVFEHAMETEVVERLELEVDLQRAIERNQLVVHYQPVVTLDGPALAGFEALVRWQHPERGLVPPPQFIPLAEETGLIVDLGRHVLREACRQAAAWATAFPTARPRLMSVNLSGRQLEDARIVADVAAALADSGLPPEALMLEITETVLMHDTETTVARLAELKALGVGLAVDDFGTGYSSLRYLRRFPIDVLKMAKPFVDGLHADQEGRALARAIVDIATSLRLRCVAEGIEEPDQAASLRDLGCELGQGFHFARPMPARELEALLRDTDPARPFAVSS